MFRLMFTITFTLDGVGSCEEKIMSRPFQVYSNRKKNVKGQEKPTVIDIKPKEGSSAQETEMWIKGRGFSDRGTPFCTQVCSRCLIWRQVGSNHGGNREPDNCFCPCEI